MKTGTDSFRLVLLGDYSLVGGLNGGDSVLLGTMAHVRLSRTRHLPKQPALWYTQDMKNDTCSDCGHSIDLHDEDGICQICQEELDLMPGGSQGANVQSCESLESLENG